MEELGGTQQRRLSNGQWETVGSRDASASRGEEGGDRGSWGGSSSERRELIREMRKGQKELLEGGASARVDESCWDSGGTDVESLNQTTALSARRHLHLGEGGTKGDERSYGDARGRLSEAGNGLRRLYQRQLAVNQVRKVQRGASKLPGVQQSRRGRKLTEDLRRILRGR